MADKIGEMLDYLVRKNSIVDKNKNADGLYQCSLCAKTYKKYTTYSFHYTSHSREFKCPDLCCSKTFTVIGNLKQHFSRKHIKETVWKKNKDNNYECSKCDKTFKHEPSIHAHVTECFGYCIGVNYHHK